MSKGEELDLAEVAKLPPFMLVGSLMHALVAAAVACVLGVRGPTAMAMAVLAAALFVGLTFDGFVQRSQTETRWAFGLTVILWIVVCGTFAQFTGLAIFAGAGMIGAGAYLIKRRRCGAKGRRNVTIEPQNVTDGQWQNNIDPLKGWWVTALVAVILMVAAVIFHRCPPVFTVVGGVGLGLAVALAAFALTYRRGAGGENAAFVGALVAVLVASAAVVWGVGFCGLLFAVAAIPSMVLTLAVRQLNTNMPWS